MASDAKPASPAPEDSPADDAMDAEPTEEKAEAEEKDDPEADTKEKDDAGADAKEKDDAVADAQEKADAEAEADEKDDAEAYAEEKDDAEAEEEEEQQAGEERDAELPKKQNGRGRRRSSGEVPATPTSVGRPSRERKTVERYSELSPRVTPSKKSPAIVQGSGTKLKDIPNVSFKLSKRKADENLQSLHALMFGKKSGVHYLKRNISQFSGFVWVDNEDKQRTRMKEKLDKFNKEKLLDFCEILDIPSKQTAKKEEVSAKLLQFLESPCITRDVVLADKLIKKKRARKSKGSGPGSAEGVLEKKRRKLPNETVEAQTENDGEDDNGSAGSDDLSMEENEDSELKEHDESDEELDETPKKKSIDDKEGTKEAESKKKENNASGKQSSTKRAKAPSKPGQHTKNEPDVELESKKAVKKSSKNSSNKTNVPVDTVNKVSKSKKDDGKGQSNNSVISNNKTLKKQGKGKGGKDAMSAPSTEQLHAVVGNILKEVDFNTATLADILRQLGAHFKMDLMDRKSEVKRIIEEVINSMSDDEGEEETHEDDAQDNGKVGDSKEDPDEGDDK